MSEVSLIVVKYFETHTGDYDMPHLWIRFLPTTLAIAALALVAAGASADKHGATAAMLTDTCVACHGSAGSSTGPAIPSLATLSPNYLVGAMLAYKYTGDEAGLEKALAALEARDAKDLHKRYGVVAEDMLVFERYSTIMSRIAKGYTDEEILMMGPVFSEVDIKRATQAYDSDKAAVGKRLHKEFCEKCHEDEGRLTEDDTGMLAGQWMPYLSAVMEDYREGRRGMPKKMKSKLRDMRKEHGDAGVEALIHYYGSINN